MTIKKTWVFLTCLILLFDCGQKRTKSTSPKQKVTNSDGINLDTFDTYPADIKGCSCSCSNTLADFNINEHICVTSYWDIAYLKLNGELTRFTLTKYDTLVDGMSIVNYENEKFKLTIECKFTETEYESSSTIGTIRLKDKSGEVLTKKFVGGCGC
jgi:hypothetical protein